MAGCQFWVEIKGIESETGLGTISLAPSLEENCSCGNVRKFASFGETLPVGMKSFLHKHEVWLFLILLVLVNAVFVTSVVEGVIPEKFYSLGRFFLLGALLFGLVFCLRGFSGVWDILRPMIEWRRSIWLYAFALLWTLALCLIVLIGKGVITGRFLTTQDLVPGIKSLPSLMPILLVSSFIGEMVWISYAVRKLSKTFTHYVSALIVGFFWTLWWLPMVVHNYGIIPNLPFVALLINQMGIAAMCAFVYYHTKSGLLVLIMQIVFNATILIFPVTPNEGGPLTYWAFAITYFIAATLLFFGFGPNPLHGSDKFGRMQTS